MNKVLCRSSILAVVVSLAMVGLLGSEEPDVTVIAEEMVWDFEQGTPYTNPQTVPDQVCDSQTDCIGIDCGNSGGPNGGQPVTNPHTGSISNVRSWRAINFYNYGRCVSSPGSTPGCVKLGDGDAQVWCATVYTYSVSKCFGPLLFEKKIYSGNCNP